ncbi:MAG: hypothetical protein QXF35_00025 [Candidatus Bilamarchaeaceae archaeon]
MDYKKFCADSCNTRNLRSRILSARNFFKKHNELLLYDHGKRVLNLAISSHVVDKRVINGKVNVDEGIKNFNSILTEILLYHTIDMSHVNPNNCELPEVVKNSAVLLLELQKFSLITNLIRSGAQPLELVNAVNHSGAPPAALPAVLIDVAQTHLDDSKTFRFIKKNYNPIFRFYKSKEEADIVTLNTAKFGEIFLAQVAELFGYPSIAGEIFLQSYSVNHPYLFETIVKFNKDSETIHRLETTCALVRSIRKAIKGALSSMDFEFELQLREKKNLGKQMKKLAFRLRKDYPSIIAHGNVDSEKQVNEQKKVLSELSLFDFFNDLVALRVIIDKFKGKPLVELSQEENKNIVDAVKDLVCQVVRTINPLSHKKYKIDEKFYNTERGYKSWHLDIDPRDDTFSKYEIQIRTREWHDIAEYGKAAHYLYIGDFGNSDLLEKIQSSYQELLTSLRNHK